MDIVELRRRCKEGFLRYRAVAAVILAGILLMALPESGRKKEAPTPPPPVEAPEFSQRLGELLSSLEGAGRVEVLLSEEVGAETDYQSDEDRSAPEEIRRKTVVVTDGQRQEQGLVRQIRSPRYRGAVVLAQGAGSASVRLSLVEAVASATGLTADKITVLKMK